MSRAPESHGVRERAERLIAHAERSEMGAAGESETAAALTVLGPEFTVRHDLAWPGRPQASIDHVVVGPTGIFVIDAKSWSGRVEVREDTLRQNGFKREREVASVTDATAAVAALVPDYAAAAFSAITLVRPDRVRATTKHVWICSTATLVELITSRPVILAPEHVARVVDQLHASLLPKPIEIAPVRDLPQRPSRVRTILVATVAAAGFVVAAPSVLAVVQSVVG